MVFTHYSDEAPVAAITQVTKVDVPEPRTVKGGVDNDYYSIRNQWRRLHHERLEYERLKLEKARLKAVQKMATPQVVYVNESRQPQYVVVYSGSFDRRHRFGHHKHNKRHYSRATKGQMRGKFPPGLHPGRLKLGSYSQLQ